MEHSTIFMKIDYTGYTFSDDRYLHIEVIKHTKWHWPWPSADQCYASNFKFRTGLAKCVILLLNCLLTENNGI